MYGFPSPFVLGLLVLGWTATPMRNNPAVTVRCLPFRREKLPPGPGFASAAVVN